jgi:hypothetical protein
VGRNAGALEALIFRLGREESSEKGSIG